MNSCVVWITGLSAAGKSTLARQLARRRHGVYIDADNERRRWAHIGFNSYDRVRSMVRLAQRVRNFQRQSPLIVVAAISPKRIERRVALTRLRPARWLLVHLATPLSFCERRDSKKLYERAHAGRLVHVSGVDETYEQPHQPGLYVPGHRLSRLACLAQTQLAVQRYHHLLADYFRKSY